MQTQLIGLYAETPIHAGAGKALGVIDLPIMREAHTGWPCVYGSAVKGAMRAAAERSTVNKNFIADVFGPDTDNASDHAGALLVGDARLLLLPVRSLTTHFKWVTCPALLARAAADARRMGKTPPALTLPTPLGESDALVPATAGTLYLEEFQFTAKQHDLAAIVEWLAGYVAGDDFATRLKNQLVIVSDDLFSHLAQFATPVAPHIAIDNKTKTVTQSALWYEETLPPETVLYVPLAVHDSRKNPKDMPAEVLLGHTLGLFPAERPYLQLGGNETVGMGWCCVKAVN